MKIVCDRCEKELTDFDHASKAVDWGRLLLMNSNTKYYLCPDDELLRLSTENSALKFEATQLRDTVDIKSQTELDAQVELVEKQKELDQLNAEKLRMETEIVQLRDEVDSNAKKSKSFADRMRDLFMNRL